MTSLLVILNRSWVSTVANPFDVEINPYSRSVQYFSAAPRFGAVNGWTAYVLVADTMIVQIIHS